MIFRYLAVDRIPKDLQPGIVYHNPDFELGAMLCACGCGHRVDLLVPDSHQISSEDGLATIRPSVAVCDAPCRSHYIVTVGKVQWLAAFNPAHAKAVMREQIARHSSQDSRRRSWIERLRAMMIRWFNRAQAFFRR
jgi:hypothetical protein